MKDRPSLQGVDPGKGEKTVYDAESEYSLMSKAELGMSHEGEGMLCIRYKSELIR